MGFSLENFEAQGYGGKTKRDVFKGRLLTPLCASQKDTYPKNGLNTKGFTNCIFAFHNKY